MIDRSSAQQLLAEKYGSSFVETGPADIAGVAKNVAEGLMPLNGLRHPPTEATSGWYIWAGPELSQADDFFEPVHVEHLNALRPEAIEFLGLEPGWRFLLAPGHVDVWFDASLLTP
jgi:hypothetical protein